MARARRKSNVVPLCADGPLPVHGIPDQEVVDCLRELLALAEGGAINGLGVAYIGPADLITTGWYGAASTHHVAAAIARLQYRFMASWDEFA